MTGDWLIAGPKSQRSRYYNHSTFNDLVINGLVGLVPRTDQIAQVQPLLPENTWDWFCLDGVPYHGHRLTVVWDRTGERYSKGTGLTLWVDGEKVGSTPRLDRLEIRLPSNATAESKDYN